MNIESFSHGVVTIFNKNVWNSKSKIGYMPQRLGIDDCLTAVETIHYFAILQGLDKHECIKVIIWRKSVIAFRLKGKQNFSSLQSPMTITTKQSHLVNNLNEEQQRILSFYIAIMASPKLVVLDQPLAGLDPLSKY